MINVKFMMRMFDRGDFQAQRREMRDKLFRQSGFARILPTCYADHPLCHFKSPPMSAPSFPSLFGIFGQSVKQIVFQIDIEERIGAIWREIEDDGLKSLAFEKGQHLFAAAL